MSPDQKRAIREEPLRLHMLRLFETSDSGRSFLRCQPLSTCNANICTTSVQKVAFREVERSREKKPHWHFSINSPAGEVSDEQVDPLPDEDLCRAVRNQVVLPRSRAAPVHMLVQVL